MLDAMEFLGYAALNIGEGDLVFDQTFLLEMVERVSFPLLSASVVQQQAPDAAIFPPAAVIAKAGLKIGVAGVLWDGFSDYVFEHSDPASPLALLSSQTAMENALSVFDEGGVDLKILLAHCPYDELASLLHEAPGYDIVISGHDTNLISLPEGERINGALLVQTGWDGKTIGSLDLEFDRHGGLVSVNGTETRLGPSWPDHPAMESLHDDYLQRIAEAIDTILQEYPVEDPPDGGSYVGPASCAGCHEAEYQSWYRTEHATAWQTLKDRNRDFDPECFRCHTTGFQFTGGFRLESETPHMTTVQCEECHGPGAAHAASPEDTPCRLVDKTTCQKCHVPLHSPDFSYESYLEEIRH